MEWSFQGIIEIVMCVIMLISVIAVFYRSLKGKNPQTGKLGGIGARIIQFTCVTLIIPAIIILGIEKILQGETIATIVGGLIGYVLSGISNYDNKEST